MPVHDWTLVDAGIFHAFHTSWTGSLQSALNAGLLPDGYYALAEQHARTLIAGILTLHSSETLAAGWSPPDRGGIAVAEAPPGIARKQSIQVPLVARRRSLAIRHVTRHRLVALVEIVSPAYKDRSRHVEDLADKAASALEHGVHLLLVDLFPPGTHDPCGIHGAILQAFDQSTEPYRIPSDAPLTLASYAADGGFEIYLEHLAVGAALADMPLFLQPDRYVNVPLESTYQATYRGMPSFWRDVLEGKRARPS
jgi:Protein of unknown function (DUF4058)